MRPKKRILLIDADDERLSVQSFMLSTNGYAVVPASTTADAMAKFGPARPDLVLAAWPLDGAAAMLQKIFCRNLSQTVLVLAREERSIPPGLGTLSVIFGHPSNETLLERIKLLCTHKRGPKKKPVQAVMADDVLLAEAARRLA